MRTVILITLLIFCSGASSGEEIIRLFCEMTDAESGFRLDIDPKNGKAALSVKSVGRTPELTIRKGGSIRIEGEATVGENLIVLEFDKGSPSAQLLEISRIDGKLTAQKRWYKETEESLKPLLPKDFYIKQGRCQPREKMLF